MSETVSIEFTSPAGEELRFDWQPEHLLGLDPGSAEEAWRLAGELDWDEVGRVRILSGRLGDDLAIALVALDPAGASGHGEGPIGAILIKDGVPEQLAEVRLSTEAGADGAPRRVGIELHGAEDGMPLRVAGDATASESSSEGGIAVTRTALELRSAGVEGVALLETLEPV